MGKETLRYAKDYKCIGCGKQADVFFGMADPDCEQRPYCNKCCKESKRKIFMEIGKLGKGV